MKGHTMLSIFAFRLTVVCVCVCVKGWFHRFTSQGFLCSYISCLILYAVFLNVAIFCSTVVLFCAI